MSTVLDLVSLSLFKEHVKVSSNAEDALVTLYLETAREMAEKFTCDDYVSKVKSKTYTINQSIDFYIDVADIIAVSGYYKTLADVTNAYNYFIEYQKGVTINRDYPINYDNLPTYTIRYNVVVNPDDVPATVKSAIFKIAAELYANRENSSSESRYADKELNINYKLLLKPYRKNI